MYFTKKNLKCFIF